MKRCPKCEEVKPRTEFHRGTNAKDGLQGYCKGCMRTYLRQHQRGKADEARQPVLGHYGEACVQCGSTEGLGLHYPNGDREQHLDEIGATNTQQQYAWLVRHDFDTPYTIETMCGSCVRKQPRKRRATTTG